MPNPRFRVYGFYAYLISSVGFLLASIIVAWPAIESFILHESPVTTHSPEYSLNKALVLSAISIYLAVRSYIYYRLKLKTNHEPDEAV
jgi:hypothetical protein